jgi:hypothetical protein
MRALPDQLTRGIFTRQAARELGITDRQLDGKRFVRVLPRIYRSADYVMTEDDWVAAARLALPSGARLTGITRLQQLGLDFGPRRPLHFVVEGALHLAFDGVFLHRTTRLAPTDDIGVTVAAAFIAYCTRARVIDAIKVGDWLLRGSHTTIDEIRTLALAGQWRDGADEAIWILDHLDARSRSLMESETRAILTFCGLTAPEVNVAIDVGEDVTVIGDLVYATWRTVVEYEGAHHQTDRSQYQSDLDRYAILRGAGVRYVQVTKERIAKPRTLVGEVFRTLLAAGYDGPAPSFGVPWELLFRSITVAIGPKPDRYRSSGA